MHPLFSMVSKWCLFKKKMSILVKSMGAGSNFLSFNPRSAIYKLDGQVTVYIEPQFLFVINQTPFLLIALHYQDLICPIPPLPCVWKSQNKPECFLLFSLLGGSNHVQEISLPPPNHHRSLASFFFLLSQTTSGPTWESTFFFLETSVIWLINIFITFVYVWCHLSWHLHQILGGEDPFCLFKVIMIFYLWNQV